MILTKSLAQVQEWSAYGGIPMGTRKNMTDEPAVYELP
jgi:hypothetical protein